jgi:hypothetical protein
MSGECGWLMCIRWYKLIWKLPTSSQRPTTKRLISTSYSAPMLVRILISCRNWKALNKEGLSVATATACTIGGAVFMLGVTALPSQGGAVHVAT